jgi:peptidoglycan/xylan/chitin deacetylase (PgdA/CDA1 family)
VALTFDADMTAGMQRRGGGTGDSAYDPTIVGVLQETRTPATFFVTGRWAQTHPRALRELAADALFQIENHSFEHRAFASPCFGLPALSQDRKELDVLAAAAAIAAMTGRRPRYFRFPGGCHGEDDVSLVAGLGQQPVGWDVNSGDSFEREPHVVAERVLAGLRPGSIVVMHLNGPPRSPATAEALRLLVPELRNRGLAPVTLGRLLDPGDCADCRDAL